MMRIRFAFTLGCLAALLPLVVSAESEKAPRPNVVVVFSETISQIMACTAVELHMAPSKKRSFQKEVAG